MLAVDRPLLRALAAALLAIAATATAGCANLPDPLPHPPATPIDGLRATPLARLAEDSTPPARRALSGVRALAGGVQAFDARLALARHATRTLDLQYYLLADDATGRRLLRELRDAARRDVRVRLLLDICTAPRPPTCWQASPRMPGSRCGCTTRCRSSDGRLHAKVAEADRRWVLIGSMNMDSRSALANTEFGLLVDSPALAWELRGLWQRADASSTYRLRRASDGAIEWTARDGGSEVVLRSEPGADPRLRLKLSLLSLFVPDDLL